MDQRCSNCHKPALGRAFAISSIEAAVFIPLAAVVGILIGSRGYGRALTGGAAASLVLVVAYVLRKYVWPLWRALPWTCRDCRLQFTRRPTCVVVDGVPTQTVAWCFEGKWCASVYRKGWRGNYQTDFSDATPEAAVRRAVAFALAVESKRTPESDEALRQQLNSKWRKAQ